MSEARTHLAELAEAEAPPPVRAIYAEIRRLSGVPMAALIFRHLATMPGVLEEVWGALGPLLATGIVQDPAWRLAREAALPETPPIAAVALAAVGVGHTELTAVVRVVDAYNRANPVNHLGLLTLAARARDGGSGSAEPLAARVWSPPQPIGDLPPMTPPGAIPAHILSLLASLSGGTDATLAAVPSLYRHLVGWPGLLALIHVVLAPRVADGSIARAIADLAGRAEAQAAGLARHMPALPLLASHPEAQAAIRRFSGLIPQMVVIGGMLARALPREA